MEDGGWLENRSAAPHERVALSSRADLRPIFDACDRMERRVLDAFPHGKRHPAHSSVPIVAASVQRCLKSVDAALLLADRGYGPQAAMLGRTMIEDVSVAWWSKGQDGSYLAKLVAEHELSVSANIQAPGLPERSDLHSLQNVAVLSEADLQDFVAKFQVDHRAAKKHWTRLTVKAMAEQASKSMRAVDSSRLADLLSLPYLFTNLATHSSTASMNMAMKSQIYSRQPAEVMVRDSLAVTYRALVLLVPLFIEDEARLAAFDLTVKKTAASSPS